MSGEAAFMKLPRTESPEEIKGHLGLNLLRDVSESLVDFIFVHGLGGGSRKTWSLSPDPKHYWPREWLKQEPEFRHVRIHSFGYKADWAETKIVFIAHSMGGIVVKKAYILARETLRLEGLADRIHSIYFLATPHQGSSMAEVLERILRLSFSTKAFVSELSPTSKSTMDINHSFKPLTTQIELVSFYETLETKFGPASAMVIPRGSSYLALPNERAIALHADHRGVCKFDKRADLNYKILRSSFCTTLRRIIPKHILEPPPQGGLADSCEISTDEPHRLPELTGVSNSPVDEEYILENYRPM
ncbi:conserved hypothetical protein [Microsporum canis CBS 113480]|uniref:GPI inositol-deacylase n=1 Tax=Arthroderma otae (strain ATCC MYA-4605 / CBS 113480) TaxID=554155 RepID=C5FN60_ARTOC|nr:conserved hypothetical protein [Microsporum canis CBS 113480]EEQ31296.1 conserved hypothetical protein [Microsporum canis CBS 113480]